MDDNETEAARLSRLTNVAANGRWGTLAMIAIALHQEAAWIAFIMAVIILLAYVAEQMTEFRDVVVLALVTWQVFMVGFLFIAIIL